jgi:hypothetical protein
MQPHFLRHERLIVAALPSLPSLWDIRPEFEGGAMVSCGDGVTKLIGRLRMPDNTERNVFITTLNTKYHDEPSKSFCDNIALQYQISIMQEKHNIKIIPTCYGIFLPGSEEKRSPSTIVPFIVTERFTGICLTKIFANSCFFENNEQNITRRVLALRVVTQVARAINFLRIMQSDVQYFFDLSPTNIAFTDTNYTTVVMMNIAKVSIFEEYYVDYDTYALGELLFYCLTGKNSAGFYREKLSILGIDTDLATIIVNCIQNNSSQRPNISTFLKMITQVPNLHSLPSLPTLPTITPKVPMTPKMPMIPKIPMTPKVPIIPKMPMISKVPITLTLPTVSTAITASTDSIDKMSSSGLVGLLGSKNVAMPILRAILIKEYTGADFSKSNFLNDFDETLCTQHSIMPTHMSTLRDVRDKLLATN